MTATSSTATTKEYVMEMGKDGGAEWYRNPEVDGELFLFHFLKFIYFYGEATRVENRYGRTGKCGVLGCIV